MASTLSLLLLLVAIGCILSSVEGRRKLSKKQMRPTGQNKVTEEMRKFHPKQHKKTGKHRASIPDTFDSRKQWPMCKSISDIRDQAQCGTCWAVSSASVMSDRFCIASNGQNQDFISASNLAGCSFPDHTPAQNCHDGGFMTTGYERAVLFGVPSGGDNKDDVNNLYNQTDGCQPYNVPPGQAVDQTCEPSCWNSKYDKQTTQEDLRFIDSYHTIESAPGTMDDAKIADAVSRMKDELVSGGPITVGIKCYSDFQEWEPKDGPYCAPASDAQMQGGHAVRIIGWDKTPDNVYYWMIANSWGTQLGDKGIFWIEMGKNCIEVEQSVSAPVIKLPNTCGNLCDKPVDQVIRMPATDANAPIFAFEGDCTVEVTIGSDGKLVPKGDMVPIASQFIGASGPITRWMKADDTATWIVSAPNNGFGCSPVTGSTKYKCQAGQLELEDSPSTYSPNGYTYWYYLTPPEKANMVYGWPNDSGGANQYNDIGTLFTDAFSKVTSLMDVNGNSMQVCGLDKNSGAGYCGMLSYSNWKEWETQPGPQC